MRFDPQAIANKRRWLDKVLEVPEVVEHVLRRHLPGVSRWAHLPRVWEPGGGATLFHIESPHGPYLLKAKHRTVWVESLLESEQDYLRRPSLQNEYEFIKILEGNGVPKVIFFDEQDGFQFLAVEWLEPFASATRQMSAGQLLQAWERIVSAVRTLYERDLVHTDIHEHNICFRDGMPVLCDFEEARFLEQDVGFEDSLDVVGLNKYGCVGEFPSMDGAVNGLTCLHRLNAVFKTLIRERLPGWISECRFDHTCPFNLDELQQPDSRIYQSLDLPDICIEGQRPRHDPRLLLFTYLLFKLARQEGSISHVDIGSNLGTFCLQAAAYPFVTVSIGLEGFGNYVDVARTLAFLYDLPKARFFEFVCGKDRMESTFKKINFVTMLSVYHHIADKDEFLQDLRNLDATFLLAEFATQDRYYSERGSLSAEFEYIQSMAGYSRHFVLAVSQDYHRPLVLFSHRDIPTFELTFIRMASSRFTGISWAVLYFARYLTNFLGRQGLND